MWAPFFRQGAARIESLCADFTVRKGATAVSAAAAQPGTDPQLRYTP